MCRSEAEVQHLQRNDAPPGRQEFSARHPAAPGRLYMQSRAMLPEVCSDCPGSVPPVCSLNAQHGCALAQEGAARKMHAHGGLYVCGRRQLAQPPRLLARQEPAPASLNGKETPSHLPGLHAYCANRVLHRRTVTSVSPKTQDLSPSTELLALSSGQALACRVTMARRLRWYCERLTKPRAWRCSMMALRLSSSVRILSSSAICPARRKICTCIHESHYSSSQQQEAKSQVCWNPSGYRKRSGQQEFTGFVK